MKEKLTLRWFIIKLTGLIFAAYSAYNISVVIRDRGGPSLEVLIVSLIVAAIFAVLAAYAWTSEVKNLRFLVVRRGFFLAALSVLFVLKLRMAERVTEYVDFSKAETVLYGCTYFLTLVAMMVFVAYYVFVRRNLPRYRLAPIILPSIVILLFLSSFVLEIILFVGYGIGLEASSLRTVVSRPLFYLGFIGLCSYYLFLPKIDDSNVIPELPK